jgi:hypothetical protein
VFAVSRADTTSGSRRPGNLHDHRSGGGVSIIIVLLFGIRVGLEGRTGHRLGLAGSADRELESSLAEVNTIC